MISQLWITGRKLLEFRRNQRLSQSQFDADKLAKFRRLVRYASIRSPYYASIVKERSIVIDTCTPNDFPVLTKSELIKNFDGIATDRVITKQAVADFLSRSTDPAELFLNEYQVLHTSGSSGEVGYFVFSSADWFRGMAQRVRNKPSSIKPGRMRVMFFGASGGHFAGVSMASVGKRGINRLMVQIALCEINTPLPTIVEQLNAYQPDLLAGYATALKILAAKQREGALRIAPIRIEAGGEPVTEADKAELHAAFGCDVFNVYASTEHLMMGLSPLGQSTMVLYDDDLIYECHSDHSLVTNLFNYTLPLIRYRMSDVLRPVAQRSTFMPYLEIESVVGRRESAPVFINRDGVEDFISPHTINEIFVAGVTRFQLRLLSRTSFRFLVCLESSLNSSRRTETVANMERKLREFLEQKRMDNVEFEVTPVDDLPLNRVTRKFLLIVDDRAESVE